MNEESNTAVLDPPSTPELDTLQIRRAHRDDMESVVGIIRSSASWYEDIVDAEDLGEHYVDMDWARKNFRRREFFVAEIDGEIAGTISLQEVGTDHLYLGYVYLHTDHVGNGFGGDLLDFARDEGRRRGRDGLVLLAHPEAEWACRAYEKYGFELLATDREKVLRWSDGWLKPYYEEGFHLYEYRL